MQALGAAGCRLDAWGGCRLDTAGCRLDTAGCRLDAAGCRLDAAGCRLGGVAARLLGLPLQSLDDGARSARTLEAKQGLHGVWVAQEVGEGASGVAGCDAVALLLGRLGGGEQGDQALDAAALQHIGRDCAAARRQVHQRARCVGILQRAAPRHEAVEQGGGRIRVLLDKQGTEGGAQLE